jgi:hypothetical protein
MGTVFKKESHYQEYVYDFAVDGGAVSTIALSAKPGKEPLPLYAVVTSVALKVVTAFTSGGSATLAWGNTSDVDGYSGTPIAVASLTDNAVFNGWGNVAALLWNDTQDSPVYYHVGAANDAVVSVTIATAAMTAGKAVLWVEYVRPSLD